MKYKVALIRDTDPSTLNGPLTYSFYTSSQATLCCNEWVSTGGDYHAYLWDGSRWTFIS